MEPVWKGRCDAAVVAGERLVIASSAGLTLLHLTTGEPSTWRTKEPVKSHLAASEDCSRVAYCSAPRKLVRCRMKSSKLQEEKLQVASDVRGLVVDGLCAVALLKCGTILRWDDEGGQQTLQTSCADGVLLRGGGGLVAASRHHYTVLSLKDLEAVQDGPLQGADGVIGTGWDGGLQLFGADCALGFDADFKLSDQHRREAACGAVCGPGLVAESAGPVVLVRRRGVGIPLARHELPGPVVALGHDGRKIVACTGAAVFTLPQPADQSLRGLVGCDRQPAAGCALDPAEATLLAPVLAWAAATPPRAQKLTKEVTRLVKERKPKVEQTLLRRAVSGAVPVTPGLVAFVTEFGLDSTAEAFFRAPALPEECAVRLLVWRPSLTYACIEHCSYTRVRMIEAFRTCGRETAEDVLTRLAELVEAHACSAEAVEAARIPGLAPTCRLIQVVLDARPTELALQSVALLQRVRAAIHEHAERQPAAEAMLGLLHALAQKPAKAPDNQLMDLWILPI